LARPIRATIDLAALRHNYGVAKAAAPRSRVLAVVKANAYGHGLDRAARALKDADGFGLIELENAVCPQEGPVTSARQDLAAQPRALEATARDRRDHSSSVRHDTEPLRR